MADDVKRAAYTVMHIDDLPTVPDDEAPDTEWKPVRRAFGISSFGGNLFRATERGAALTHDHTEEASRHEELFVVLTGHAVFTIDGESVDAPAGTFVYVPDPATVRGARARDAGTALLALGAEPGAAFTPSGWDTGPLPDEG